MIKKGSFLLLISVVFFSLHFFVLRDLLQTKAQGENLLTNGDFESGTVAPWEGISDSDITSSEVHSGSYAVHITGQQAYQRWINVEPGKTYVLTGWVKWIEFSGSGWGYDTFSVNDDNWNTLAAIDNIHPSYERNKWNKLAVTFTATTGGAQVNFGMFGPKDNVDMYFDDFTLFEKTGNAPPTIIPTSDITSGNVPLSVNFFANVDDVDGAITYFYWDFGDGSVQTVENPTHTFYRRGTHTVTLQVWDNDGAHVSESLTINVYDDEAPEVNITSVNGEDFFEEEYSTTDISVTVGGDTSDIQSNVERVVWDNINTRQVGIISITPAPSIEWSTPTIDLKPGNNEILITVTDNEGRAGTDVINVYRNISAPIISNIQPNQTSVNVYEKFEVQFDLDTMADYWFFPYDESPPPGVDPKIGVTAEGVFTSPFGKEVRQPAFFFTEVEQTGDWQNGHYAEGTESHWMVRFSPQEEGQWHFDIEVTDASGTTRVNGGDFIANSPTKKGFVGVSKTDSRYFEFSNGDLFWPMGPINNDDYQQNQDCGMNHTRPWMGERGAYSTNWARWISSSEHHGNEGIMTRLNYKERYPGHDLSYELFYPEGFRFWLTPWSNSSFAARFKPNTEYQIKLRYKTTNITGPRNASHPYGFVIKLHGWLSHEIDIETTENSLRDNPQIIEHIHTNQDWHTIAIRYTTPNSVGDDISLYLDNVTDGQVYIDEFSIREVLPGGSLGGELIRSPRSDQHNYVDQRPAKFFDKQVEAGEQHNVFYKYVVQDKNDWVPNHLVDAGIFFDQGEGYCQKDGTKARWLQQAWWRYLIARWGYSTAIHSWELNNEGSPNSTSHYQAAQDFAKFMHENDYHPHLATTSFWCCWKPDFWGDHENFPDVDYADVHEYIDTDNPASHDLAQWIYDHSLEYYDDQVGKAIQMGETGLSGGMHDYFKTQTDPTWWHNLIWAGINPWGLSYPNYWWPYHLDQIDYHTVIKAYTDFMEGIPLNSGYYQDAEAMTSHPDLRAWGQKDVVHGKAHLWIQNRNHTWRNVVDGVTISGLSGQVTIPDMTPGHYQVEWWNTYTGAITKTGVVEASSDGLVLDLPVPLTDDAAVKASRVDPSFQVYLPLILKGW